MEVDCLKVGRFKHWLGLAEEKGNILKEDGNSQNLAVSFLMRINPTPSELTFPFRTKTHLTLNKVNQGDVVFMTGQHRALGRTASQPSTTKYFLPGDNDKV